MELVMFKVGIASEYNVLAGILYEKIGKNMRKLQVIEYIECGRHFECEAIPWRMSRVIDMDEWN